MLRIILLTCAVLVLTNSALSENIIGGEGIGGVMWFVRYTFKFTKMFKLSVAGPVRNPLP